MRHSLLARPLALVTAALVTVALVTTAPVLAQAPTLVRDLDPTAVGNPAGDPRILGHAGQTMILTATVPDHGHAVYGSPFGVVTPQLLAHFLDEPVRAAAIRPIVSTSTVLFFLRGWDLWRTDGTPGGTVFVRSVSTAVWNPPPPVLVSAAAAGNRAFFILLDGSPFLKLWVTDGTATNTRLVPAESPTELVALGGKIYMSARDASVGQELFTTDGTRVGTKLASDVNPGRNGSMPHSLFVSGNKIFFAASRAGNGLAYFAFDGKKTALLKDVDGTGVPWHFGLSPWTQFGNRFAFVAATSQRDVYSLWLSDGTAAGTTVIFPKMGPVRFLHATTTKLVFYVTDGKTHQIWASDGKTAGTKRIATLKYPVLHSTSAGNRVLFTTGSDTHGVEPWRTDGTANGTALLADIHPGAKSSDPRDFTTNSVGTFFVADDGKLGPELWTTNGTRAGTKLQFDFRPIRRTTLGSGADLFHRDAWRAYATTIPDPTQSWWTQLWATGGSARDTASLTRTSSWDAPFLGSLGAQSFFGATGQIGVLVSDGTPGGTNWVQNSERVFGLARLRGHVWFGTQRIPGQAKLWRTDGTAAGTKLAQGLPTGFSGDANIVATSRALYFIGTDGVYRNDGGGTTSKLYARTAFQLAAVGERVFFFAPGGTGYVMVESDGTANGNRIVQDPGGLRPQPAALRRGIELGGRFLFFGQTTNHGLELWQTAGSSATTGLVKDVWSGSDSGVRCGLELCRHGSMALFFADDGRTGCELWKTDGTPAGTVLVRDIRPGTSSAIGSPETEIVSAGRYAYFAANDGVHGTELWRTDGTAAGTTMVADLNPGNLPSRPLHPRLVRGRVVFGADDGVVGRELFGLDPGPHSQRIGNGCATGVPPALDGTIPKLGATLEIRVSNAAARSGVLAIGSVVNRPLHLGEGCTLYVDFAQPFVPLPFRASVGGDWTWRVALPNSPVLHGLLLPLQAAVGRTATVPLHIDLSNGLLLAVRR